MFAETFSARSKGIPAASERDVVMFAKWVQVVRRSLSRKERRDSFENPEHAQCSPNPPFVSRPHFDCIVVGKMHARVQRRVLYRRGCPT